MRFILLSLFTLSLLSCKQDNWELMTRVFSYGNQGEHERAIRLLDRIIVNLDNEIENEGRSPSMWLLYEEAHMVRGIFSLNLGDTIQARKDYDYVISLRKQRDVRPNPLVHFHRARLLTILGEYELAYLDIMESYNHTFANFNMPEIIVPWALSRTIPLRIIRSQRAMIYLGLDSLDNALDDINFTLTFDFEQEIAFYRRGKIHLRQGDTISACADWHKATDLGLSSARVMIEIYCE